MDFFAAAAAATRGPIVELGCGSGRLLAAVAAQHPGRPLVGVDRDAVALGMAADRLPAASLVVADLRTWHPPAPAGLVIVGGDLLPLLLEEQDLTALFATAAASCAPEGAIALDATRIDGAAFAEAVGDADWSHDVSWHGVEGTLVRRESRLLADPARRTGVALLEVRHRVSGPGGAETISRPPVAIRAWSLGALEAAVSGAGLSIAARGGADRFRWLLRSADA